jgi:chromosome segregation ATPase
MDQYTQSPQELPSTQKTTHQLQAVVQPQVTELRWEDKILKVPNPAYVRELAADCAQLRVDLQELRKRHQRLQQQYTQLTRVVTQIQSQLGG